MFGRMLWLMLGIGAPPTKHVEVSGDSPVRLLMDAAVVIAGG
ncbi:hypothetical protein [Solimonas sp. K1W22B-7]|nr:hypothetical protein [Solimonas sp. K1W22B-7]